MTNQNEIVVYQPTADLQLQVRLENETVWLTQAQMAQLFQRAPQNITMHIRNIYLEGELSKDATCKDFLQVQREGSRDVTRRVSVYNLDVIISVGYRVKSPNGTAFRIWANNVIKNYLLNGYAFAQRFERLEHRVSQVEEQAEELNEKQNGRKIEIRQYKSNFHDRFLIIDDDLYHFGASFKDLGRRLFAFEKMGIDKRIILEQV